MKIIKNKFLLVILSLLIIVLIPIVLAHLDVGEDKEIGDYVVDFGYSPENPKTTDNVAIALTLFDTNQEVIEPESVWVRISSSKEVVFAGTLKPENGNVAFTYKFPYADKYDITARFNDSKETIVKTNFNIQIEGKISNLEIYFLIFTIIALIIIIFVIIKLKSLKNKLKKF